MSRWLVMRSLTIHRRQNVRADALAMQTGKDGVQLPLHSGGAAVSDKALERAGGGTGGVAHVAHHIFLIAAWCHLVQRPTPDLHAVSRSDRAHPGKRALQSFPWVGLSA